MRTEPPEPRTAAEELDAYEHGEGFALVPQYDVTASAGPGRVVDQEEEVGKLAFRRSWLRSRGLKPGTCVAITVSGDSMAPTIRDGALVLVDTRQAQPREEGIYIIQVDGHLVAKRLQLDFRGGLYIRSDNQAYREQHLDAEEAEQLCVVGRVIWAGSEV
jgi:phage repressor protein C with HTH and peptisase S24 domain